MELEIIEKRSGAAFGAASDDQVLVAVHSGNKRDIKRIQTKFDANIYNASHVIGNDEKR